MNSKDTFYNMYEARLMEFDQNVTAQMWLLL